MQYEDARKYSAIGNYMKTLKTPWIRNFFMLVVVIVLASLGPKTAQATGAGLLGQPREYTFGLDDFPYKVKSIVQRLEVKGLQLNLVRAVGRLSRVDYYLLIQTLESNPIEKVTLRLKFMNLYDNPRIQKNEIPMNRYVFLGSTERLATELFSSKIHIDDVEVIDR